MTVRERLLETEEQILSPYACLCKNSQGRERPEEPCPMRTDFQRDRDRIIHCKSFRRLKHKTQVFLSPEGDHYRTRLTHTLEVSQIARTVSRALRLNEDLTEAMAMGHDLGHTPFGHIGERTLNEICPHGYRHNLQSVRVVKFLENDGRGLNLTLEVENGIECHSAGVTPAKTLEGRVVRYADKIAYMNHDIEDAIRAGVLKDSDIPPDLQAVLGKTKSERITSFITSLVENSSDDIRMSTELQKAYNDLNAFMFEAVYRNPVAKSEESKAMDLIQLLYEYFVKQPDKLPVEYQKIAKQWDIHWAVCDYISGMSDRFAVTTFQNLFIPKSWVSV